MRSPQLAITPVASILTPVAPRGERLSVRDTTGPIGRLLDRRDKNDIAWMRVAQ